MERGDGFAHASLRAEGKQRSARKAVEQEFVVAKESEVYCFGRRRVLNVRACAYEREVSRRANRRCHLTDLESDACGTSTFYACHRRAAGCATLSCCPGT